MVHKWNPNHMRDQAHETKASGNLCYTHEEGNHFLPSKFKIIVMGSNQLLLILSLYNLIVKTMYNHHRN